MFWDIDHRGKHDLNVLTACVHLYLDFFLQCTDSSGNVFLCGHPGRFLKHKKHLIKCYPKIIHVFIVVLLRKSLIGLKSVKGYSRIIYVFTYWCLVEEFMN
jgi:hypothetical protein